MSPASHLSQRLLVCWFKRCGYDLLAVALPNEEPQNLDVLLWLSELTRPYQTPPRKWRTRAVGGGRPGSQSLFAAVKLNPSVTGQLIRQGLKMSRRPRTQTKRGVAAKRRSLWHLFPGTWRTKASISWENHWSPRNGRHLSWRTHLHMKTRTG